MPSVMIFFLFYCFLFRGRMKLWLKIKSVPKNDKQAHKLSGSHKRLLEEADTNTEFDDEDAALIN